MRICLLKKIYAKMLTSKDLQKPKIKVAELLATMQQFRNVLFVDIFPSD